MQILIKIPNEWICTQEVVKFIILLQFQITLQYNTKIIEACRKKVEKIWCIHMPWAIQYYHKRKYILSLDVKSHVT